MGSSGSGVLDFGLGSIVWVRRRNGSWWPGKILAPDELLTAHLMSPRTGTPVKLLGREDASIDWYNLEKSKRVKAFRCGDFDECIERAESSLGMPAKKREKYARREDAILHALELEKELLEKEQGGIGSSDFKNPKICKPLQKTFVASSDNLPFENGNPGHAKPDESSTESDSSIRDEKLISFYRSQNKEETQLGLADDKSVSLPQMRDLQDFGLKATGAKDSCFPSTSNGSQSPPADNHSYPAPCDGVNMVNKSCVGIKLIQNEERSKEIFVKRHDRCQVMPNFPTVPSSHLFQPNNYVLSPYELGDQTENICPAKRKRYHYLPSEFSDCLDYSESVPSQMKNYLAERHCEPPDSLMDENPCELIEDEQSESSETDDLDTESDRDANLLSGSSEADYRRAHVGFEKHRKHKYVGNEELDGLTVSGDLFNLHDHDAENPGVSKWQMKGKRNIRYLNKKLGHGGDVKDSSGYENGTYMEENRITFKRRALEHGSNYNHRSDGFSNDHTESEMIDNDFKTPVTGYYNRGYTSTSKASSNHHKRTGHRTMDWEDLGWEDHLSFPGYLYIDEYLDPIFVSGHRMRTPLIEVDLKVQASYKKPHVPIISLMSKIDGKAIIGHPIPIEVLTDGFSETIFPTKNDIYKEAPYNDEEEDRTLPPVWRTGRRTASTRVPRSHPSSALNTDEHTDHLYHLGKEVQANFQKPKDWGFIQKKSSTSNKNFTHISRPPLDRKLSRKLQKKVSLSSNQKTRTLSSIGIEQKIRRPKHHSDGFPLDGLIKNDSVPTALACIPVKLVFSRLYEAVGRPPATVNHEAMIISMDSKTTPL